MSEKIVVVGGVAAGATAAAKARRTSEEIEITLIEKGDFISYANCGLPYHVSGVIERRNSLLLHTPRTFGRRFNTEVLIKTEALSIDKANKTLRIKNEEGIKDIKYDKLILSTGAKSIIPPIKNIENIDYFSMRTIDDMDEVKDFIEKNNPKSAIIIGAGYIGIETAEALFHCNLEVTLIEAAKNIIPMFPPEVTLRIKDEMLKSGINLIENTMVTEVTSNNNKIEVITNTGKNISADMIILCAGVKPDTDLAETANIKVGKLGGVLVNEYMETSEKDIYAAGDMVEKRNLITGKNFLLPLAGVANRQGRVAGANAAGYKMQFKGAIGTSIVGFNEACVAHTGLTLEMAISAGFDADFVYTEDAHRVTYYPDPKYIFLKLIYDKKTGKILGATASGTTGVERRIDVLSTAIYGNLTIDDLEDIELCYSPPYGAAKDSVNIAAFVANNQRKNLGFGITPQKYLELIKKDNSIQLFDVRTRVEFKMGNLENSINIYVNDIRKKLDKFDKSKPVYIYCTVGFRGYIAVRILRNLGYEAYNILGGIEAVERLKRI
jgi:NADPH-dependent 2,4-dienoyl-CoA reductase/sulfur reductase-like enzyme/rhodanese-related sulfurtransferase